MLRDHKVTEFSMRIVDRKGRFIDVTFEHTLGSDRFKILIW